MLIPGECTSDGSPLTWGPASLTIPFNGAAYTDSGWVSTTGGPSYSIGLIFNGDQWYIAVLLAAPYGTTYYYFTMPGTSDAPQGSYPNTLKFCGCSGGTPGNPGAATVS